MFQTKPPPLNSSSVLHLCNDDTHAITPRTNHNRARAVKEELKKKVQMAQRNIAVYQRLANQPYTPTILRDLNQ